MTSIIRSACTYIQRKGGWETVLEAGRYHETSLRPCMSLARERKGFSKVTFMNVIFFPSLQNLIRFKIKNKPLKRNIHFALFHFATFTYISTLNPFCSVRQRISHPYAKHSMHKLVSIRPARVTSHCIHNNCK